LNGEIFSIGTELLMGELTDANASWIAARLPALGIQLQWVSIIGDNLQMLNEAFSRGLQRSDIIFTTGGLGPTRDDLTREAIAQTLGETRTVQKEVVEQLERYFQSRGIAMPLNNLQQAHLIPSARFIRNRNGTAPGWWAQRDGKIIIAMPGPPGEMHPIWEDEVAPRLAEMVNDGVTITRNIKTIGLSEGAVDETVAEFFGLENPYLGIYSKPDGIHLRMIARAKDAASARALIQPMEEGIVARLAPYIWGYDDETPEQAIGKVLVERGLTLATMESCSGGFLANSITDVPDSSTYYKGGMVVYSDELMIANGVSAQTIRRYGTVSQETATAMAQAIRKNLSADLGIGITGVAGPSELEGKPVGQVYLSIAGPDDVKEASLRIPPRRAVIKRRIANTALIELRRMINAGRPTLKHADR
jgi:nicotinamide-nucleotide amidase